MTPFDEDLQRVRAAVLAAKTQDELLDALGISGLSPEGYWVSIVWLIMKGASSEPNHRRSL
jgi:hypothetical protein